MREGVGRLAGDGDAVVAEDGLDAVREEEGERVGVVGEVADNEAFDGSEERDVEVVDPELVEVAEDHVGRALGDDLRPVIEKLVVVLFRGVRRVFSSR